MRRAHGTLAPPGLVSSLFPTLSARLAFACALALARIALAPCVCAGAPPTASAAGNSFYVSVSPLFCIRHKITCQ